MVIPVLSFVSVSKDAETITLKDATGTYDGSTNLGGYGTPNADPPTVIGIRARYWPDSEIYASLVTEDTDFLTALLGDGVGLTKTDLGMAAGEFSPGVHQFKYYPLEEQDLLVDLVLNSTLVTVASGADVPDGWDTSYLGIVFQDPDDNSFSKIYLIDRTKTVSSSSLYLTEKFVGTTKDDYIVHIAPEADLKVLVSQNANACLVSRIGKMAADCTCNKDEIDLLMHLTMQMFASQVDFNCIDYQNAHNKVVGVYLECNNCKTTCACS